MGDSGGGEKLTRLHLKDPSIIEDSVMEKAMMDAMDWDSEDGVEDGHEHVSPITLFFRMCIFYFPSLAIFSHRIYTPLSTPLQRLGVMVSVPYVNKEM